MYKSINSIEMLYQLIVRTLPEGYIGYSKDIWEGWADTNSYGVSKWPNCYFRITMNRSHDVARIEHGEAGIRVITDVYKEIQLI